MRHFGLIHFTQKARLAVSASLAELVCVAEFNDAQRPIRN